MAVVSPPRSGLLVYLVTTGTSALLILAVLYISTARLDRTIETARQELAGAMLIDQLTTVMSPLQRVRGLSYLAHREPGGALGEEVTELERMLEAQFSELKESELGRRFEVDHLLRQLHFALERHTAGEHSSTSAESEFAFYTELVLLLYGDVIQRIALNSELLQDPEADTYLLVDLLVNGLPRVVDSVGQLRGRFSGFLADAPDASAHDRMAIHRALAEADLNHLRRHWRVIAMDNPDIQALTSEPIRAADRLSLDLLESSGPGTSEDPLAYFARGSRVIEAWCGVCKMVIDELQQRLAARIDRLQRERLMNTSASLAALAMLLFATTLFYRRDRRAVRQLAEQHRELEQLSRTDPLTGLNNRRPLDELFGQELRRAARGGRGITFAIVDIDHFKRFNDTHGHQAGDQALAAVAESMRHCLSRAGDHLFRIGGEEFCYLHPSDGGSEARETAERIRAAVERLELPQGRITVSIGLCCLLTAGGDHGLDEAMRRADEALYQAKNGGRNRVELCPGCHTAHASRGG